MELQHLFLGLIGAMGTVHLLASVGQWIGQLVPKRPEHRAVLAATTKKRDDWYVFFHCADLYGTDRAASRSMPERRDRIAATATPQRQPERRPRIQARM